MFSQRNILIYWAEWHFLDTARIILIAWKNFLLFNLRYFSLPILFRTLFSYWHKYKWSYGRGFDVKVYFEAAISNLISRVIGAIMRSFLILIGVIVEILIFFAGLIVFFVWLFLPFIFIWGIIFSMNILF